MLHVLLQILAILGIILLCILELLILLLLLILFVPIRYKAMGKKDAENQEIHVKVSYLLHILSVCYDLYGKESDLRIKIFGIRLKSGKKKKIKEELGEETEETITEEPTDLVAAQDTPLTTEDGPVESEQKDKDTKEKENLGEAKKAEKKSLSEKMEEFREKILYTIRNFCDKIKDIVANITYYKDFLTDTNNKKLYGRLWSRFLKILKSILPRRIKANLHIGTGSPDTTGYLCALYGIFISKFGNNVILDADFENKVLEGDFFLKGRVMVFTLLRHALPILFDKQLREFKKGLKREE
ncbi:MAG: hypothetical protein ACI4EX_08060 [Lachnospiraceae bacterium]